MYQKKSYFWIDLDQFSQSGEEAFDQTKNYRSYANLILVVTWNWCVIILMQTLLY